MICKMIGKMRRVRIWGRFCYIYIIYEFTIFITNLLREPERILQGGVNDRTLKTWHCEGTNHKNGMNMSHANRNVETCQKCRDYQKCRDLSEKCRDLSEECRDSVVCSRCIDIQ